jgi:hypothetical protein
MYKVSYYIGGGSMVGFKWFNTLAEATDFAISQPRESIMEIKLYKEMPKKEDRT